MSGVNDWRQWVDVAEEDYKLVISSLRHRPPVAYGACFHAQQCAEKYLKAILVERGQAFPKIHDLSRLSVLCEQAGVIVLVSEDQLETLSHHAVQTRYPDDIPTLEEAREAVETARAVRKFTRKFLHLK
jgi:HEPN domain-containing protein